MRGVVASLVVIGLISFYFISWRLNKKQELPAGFGSKFKGCDSCSHTGCGMHPVQRGEVDE